MADQHALPSRNPAGDGSIPGMVALVLDKFLQGLDDMLPATVISFNRSTNRVRVQPAIRVLTTDETQVSRAPIASLPVFEYGGGGMLLSFNLKPGDTGWIKANDRDVSQFLRTYAETAPSTLRKHNFSDAVFIPDAMRGFTISGEDAEHAVLQTLDGSIRVALWPDRVKITAGALTAEVGPAAITLTGPVVINGAIAHNGVLTNVGGISIDGLPFGTHRHTNVTNGPDTSGGPTP